MFIGTVLSLSKVKLMFRLYLVTILTKKLSVMGAINQYVMSITIVKY